MTLTLGSTSNYRNGSGNGQPQAYGEAAYWDNRYRQDNGAFDWYQQFSGLVPLLHLYIPKRHRILMVGCGNAVLSEDMVNDGYEEIVNIDISSVVIEAMQKKYQDYPQLIYATMDVRDMSAFESSSFDSVIDKGMLDSLMCGHNAQQSARKMLDEVRRVLKPGGVYMLVTYGGPHVRMPHLKAQELWTITLHVLNQDLEELWIHHLGQ
uniref:Methyltransferase type 11 domain-containing protein n=1 Tax=Araucaria cunninghamii TaxID=56994 RepID=A0A0D6R812_ARACU